MAKEIEMQGIDNLIRVMALGGSRAPRMLAKALVDEAHEIMNKSQDQVPVDTGVLKGSGMVHQPVITSQEILVELTYGGSAKQYALIQHENESYNHKPGKKAKYLSDPVEDALPTLDEHLGLRMEAMLRGLA